ncbi:type II secretion system protein [Kiritimatiellota bacterium B12222]|nr:type II secretion system protein [Kiritimatiellota bacterium B12222]
MNKHSSKAGMTLVEILISFTIFAMVMTTVAWMLISANRIGESARNRLNALQQARASLEEVGSAGYGSAPLAIGTHSVSRGGLTGQYVVTEPDSNERKRVVMTYAYPSFGKTATVELQAEFSNALH